MKNFITFEGGECTGKTSIINYITSEFDRLGITYITTREPGGIRIAEKIRDIILDVNNKEMTPECEALLYAASRMQHLKERVIPALDSGKIVLCDRFLDSSLAYQGYARGLGMDAILKANAFALDYLPSLTILIDLEPEIALKRLANKDRESKKDRLDSEGISFHKKVYEGYHEVLKMYPDRIIVIDGNKPLKDLQEECLKVVLDHIKG